LRIVGISEDDVFESALEDTAQVPMRPTTSAGVLYWRQQLLFRQRMQREFVMKADLLRIRHATTMGAITGVSSSVVFDSARQGAGRGRIAGTGNPQEGIRPDHTSFGSTKAVFRMEPRFAGCPEPLIIILMFRL
jgi:hypothetical protein